MNDILARWSGALALLAGGPTGYGPHDVEALAAATERVVAENARLRADLAEALATLANERGEGEPPEEGWRSVSSTNWTRGVGGTPGYASVSRGTPKAFPWTWYTGGHEGHAPTARAAMRAASAAAKGER